MSGFSLFSDHAQQRAQPSPATRVGTLHIGAAEMRFTAPQTTLRRFTMTFRTAGSIAALAISLGLTAQALAQTTPPAPAPAAPKTPVAGQIMTQDANTILAS